MRVRRAGDEDRDEAAAQRFGLNAELPSPFHGHEDHGKLRDLGDAQRACALLLQIVVTRNLRQQQNSNTLTRRCAITVWATSPARRQTSATIASAVAAPALKSEAAGM